MMTYNKVDENDIIDIKKIKDSIVVGDQIFIEIKFSIHSSTRHYNWSRIRKKSTNKIAKVIAKYENHFMVKIDHKNWTETASISYTDRES